MTKISNTQIVDLINQSGHNKVKFAVADIDGVLRGKIIHKDKFLSILDGSVGFCDVIFGWDSSDVCYNNTTFTGWHTGYPDVEVKLDLNTLRYIPWENGIPFFIADLSESKTGSLICPRSLLKRVIDKGTQMGYSAMFSLEYEWFNFLEDANELAKRGYRNPQPITLGMFGYSLLRPSKYKDYYNQIFDDLEKFNVKLEGMHTETGPGVYEAAIKYDRTLEAADKAILFKQSVKEIAAQYGIIASFMAKWNHDLPGCGGHIHQSLWNLTENKNLFYNASDPNGMSEVYKHYLAGQLHCLPYILPLFAPNVNSYKRLVEGAWAPTTQTWGVDNRTAAFRVIGNSETSTRLETRVAGADINSYLAISASLAAGLYGIQHALPLQKQATVGNAYQLEPKGELPLNLWEATQKMKNSPLAKELFGDEFVAHFCATREWEWNQFNRKVTDWELSRYFEII